MQDFLQQAITIARGIWRYRWYAMTLAWAIALTGWIMISRLPDEYSASARIHVDTDSILRPLLSGLAVRGNADQRVNLMSRTLLSRPNLEKVARMTDLDVTAKTQEEMDNLLTKLAGNTSLSGSRDQANLYHIAYRDSDPQVVKKVVQALLDIFVESTLGDTREDSDSAQKFLDQQIKEYEGRLIAAEERLKEFKQKNVGLMSTSGQEYFQRMQQARSQLSEARLSLEESINRRDELKRQLSGEEPAFGLGAPPSSQGNMSSPLDLRIQALQTRLDELMLKYTDQHPDVLAVKETIEALQKEKQQELKLSTGTSQIVPGLEANPVYQQLKISLGQAEADVATLSVRVREYEERVVKLEKMTDTIPEVEAQLKRLDRDYSVNKQNYDALLTRRESAKLSMSAEKVGDNVKFKVIDPPRAPLEPTGPDRLLLSSGVLVAGIGGGIALALLLSQIRPTFYDRRNLRHQTGLPVFGVISRVWTADMIRIRRLEFSAFLSVGAVLLFAYIGVLLIHHYEIESPLQMFQMLRAEL